MPKPTKLHAKGKPISIQKPCNASKETSLEYSEDDHENAVRQFELELCWCIQQLERTLTNKKGTEKQMQETWKTLQVLKNNNQPIIRKRQLMRTHFGDYRAKMLAEEKKLAKMASKMKITEKPVHKATFLRKSVFQTTGDSSFRFNFDIAPDQENKGNPNANPRNTELAGNTESQGGNVACSKGDANVTQSGDSNHQKQPVTEDNSNTFKFKFSGSEFKFNFDRDSTNNLF